MVERKISKAATSKTRKKVTGSDAVSRAQQIAERAKPNMRATQVVALSDNVPRMASMADVSAPDLDLIKRKYGASDSAKPIGKNLHMVVMEPRVDSADDTAGRQRKVIIVDDEKVVGEQG